MKFLLYLNNIPGSTNHYPRAVRLLQTHQKINWVTLTSPAAPLAAFSASSTPFPDKPWKCIFSAASYPQASVQHCLNFQLPFTSLRQGQCFAHGCESSSGTEPLTHSSLLPRRSGKGESSSHQSSHRIGGLKWFLLVSSLHAGNSSMS